MEANTPQKQKQHEPQQIYPEATTTPKKKAVFISREPSTSRRIKSYTQIKEKQSVSPIYFFLVFVWGVAIAAVVVMAFQTKLTNAEADAKTEISQCKIDYELNRCASPVKKLVDYCNAKINCMNQLAVERVDKSVSYSRLLGQIMYEFTQGLGILGLAVGVCLIGMCVRQKGRTKETITMQFFQDP